MTEATTTLTRAGTVPEAIELVACFHDMAVMRQPIQQRRRHLGIPEHAGPFGEGQIGRDQHVGVCINLRTSSAASAACISAVTNVGYSSVFLVQRRVAKCNKNQGKTPEFGFFATTVSLRHRHDVYIVRSNSRNRCSADVETYALLKFAFDRDRLNFRLLDRRPDCPCIRRIRLVAQNEGTNCLRRQQTDFMPQGD